MRKAALIIALLLGGCAYRGGGIRPLRPLEIALSAYNPVAAEALTGSLMYEGGCLLFRDDKSGGLLLPVWPAGSTFNGTAVLFHHPGKSDQWVIIAQEFVIEGQREPWATLGPGSYFAFQNQCRAQPFTVARVRPAD
jgi:hypothetical protein